MKKYVFLILLFFNLAYSLIGKDTYFRGFYHGENVFIRNPYLDQKKGFCIEEVYLNGVLVIESPAVSAFELNMENLVMDSRVVIRIVHSNECQPEITNLEVIEEDLKFSWLKVYVDDEQIIWITTKESKEGFYVVEKELQDGWMPLDTIKTKGGIFINQHCVVTEHNYGENIYRVQYHDPKRDIDYSEPFIYESDKREISHAITDDWVIEFTEEVSFWLYNANNRIIKRGKDVSCDIRTLPNGQYLIKYDNKEVSFEKD